MISSVDGPLIFPASGSATMRMVAVDVMVPVKLEMTAVILKLPVSEKTCWVGNSSDVLLLPELGSPKFQDTPSTLAVLCKVNEVLLPKQVSAYRIILVGTIMFSCR